MSPTLIISCIGLYFILLLLIAWFTSRHANQDSYYIGNKQSPWFVVAFGLIGDSLSGVTFISVPGAVGAGQFSYMQIVLGYIFGYLVISEVLLPLYYRLNLTSIYSYLRTRFGFASQKSGSFFFILSRLVGAAFRLYIALIVLDVYLFRALHVPFGVSAAIVIFLILVYTFRGGIKTLVWTDMLQSGFLLTGLVISFIVVSNGIDTGEEGLVGTIYHSDYSKLFFFDDWLGKNNFFKQFFGGMFIAVVMTGLDQNMMQKNLSCRTLADAQKNIRLFSIVVVFINLIFVSLGACLYLYAQQHGVSIPARSDELFPTIALSYVGGLGAVFFILGITAATFSSADSVLTTLTTSFCIDILNMNEHESSTVNTRKRQWIHIGFAFLLLALINVFKEVNNDAVINSVFKFAGFTYGPLLGLFSFGLFTRFSVQDKWVPFICCLSPVICYLLDVNSKNLFNGYQFGNELLILNGAITFAGLMMIRNVNSKPVTVI